MLTVSKDINLKHKLVLSSNGTLSWKCQLPLKTERKQGKKRVAQHYWDVNPAAQVVVGPLSKNLKSSRGEGEEGEASEPLIWVSKHHKSSDYTAASPAKETE